MRPVKLNYNVLFEKKGKKNLHQILSSYDQVMSKVGINLVDKGALFNKGQKSNIQHKGT